jgi:hypothetical protein
MPKIKLITITILYFIYGIIFFKISETNQFSLLILTLLIYLMGKFLLIFNTDLLKNFSKNRINSKNKYSPIIIVTIIESLLFPMVFIYFHAWVLSNYISFSSIQITAILLAIMFFFLFINIIIFFRIEKTKSLPPSNKTSIFSRLCLLSILFSEIFAVSTIYKWAYTCNLYYKNAELSLIGSLTLSLLMATMISLTYSAFYFYRANFTDNFKQTFNIRKKILVIGINAVLITILGFAIL